jgi:hypothetical protein
MTSKSLSGFTAGVSSIWLGALLVVAVTLAPGRASAQVYTSYLGDECVPTYRGQAYSIGSDYGIIAEEDSISIVCPITKHTSGRNISSGDMMYDVNITVDDHGHSPGLTCQVTLYTSQVPSGASPTNVVNVLGPYLTYPTWDSYDFGEIPEVGWWGSSSWLYAQLECTLKNGEELVAYQTSEAGSATGEHIYSPTQNCTPVSGTEQGNISTGPASLPGTQPGGMIESPGGQSFFYQCYQPNYWAEFSMGPCISTVQSWDWSYSSSGPWGSAHAEPGSGQNNAWPSFNFPSTTLPASGHTNTSGTFLNTAPPYVFFQLNEFEGGFDGDMSIISFRDSYSEPP